MGLVLPMKLQLANLPRLIAERRGSVILGMVIIAMLWTGIGLKYFEDADGDLRSAERANKNFAISRRTCCDPSERSTRRCCT
jgi:hypothetical protein